MADITPSFRAILLQLELLSDGATSRWNSSGGGRMKPGTRDPTGDERPPHIIYREAFLATNPDNPQHMLERSRELFDAWMDRTRMTGDLPLHPNDVEALAAEELRLWRGHGIDRSKVVGETREQEEARMLVEGRGLSVDEVALRFHCTPTRVRKVRAKAEQDAMVEAVLDRPKLSVEERRRKAREYHERGLTLRQIATLLDCPKTTIARDIAA